MPGKFQRGEIDTAPRFGCRRCVLFFYRPCPFLVCVFYWGVLVRFL